MTTSNNTNSITDQKAQLRDKAFKWRAKLTHHEVMQASRNISERLEQLNFSNVRSAHSYRAISKNNEIDPSVFLKWLSYEHPKIRVTFAPQKSDLEVLATKSHFDLILVPLLISTTSNLTPSSSPSALSK